MSSLDGFKAKAENAQLEDLLFALTDMFLEDADSFSYGEASAIAMAYRRCGMNGLEKEFRAAWNAAEAVHPAGDRGDRV